MAAIGAAEPNVGKTHQKWCRLILDTADLSGVSRQVGSFGASFATSDITGYSAGVHHFQLGHATHVFNGYQAVFSNLATVGSHTELKDLEEYIASYCIGVKAAPEVGSAAWLSSMEQITYNVTSGAGSVMVDVDLEKAITDADHIIPFGVVLEAATQRSESLDQEGVDNIVASTNGIVAHLQIVQSSGTTWSFDIEGSSDDEDADPYASIATFNADGATLVAERIDVAGAVEQYLRLALVRLGGAGTVTFWLTVARGINL
jgi:hypothetical protein